MLFPIDTRNLSIVLIGEPTPSLKYGTDEQKKNLKGQPLYKLPVLISGTGERLDPTTNVVVPGPLPQINKGVKLNFENLKIMTWSMRGSDGVTRNGTVLKADGVIGGSK